MSHPTLGLPPRDLTAGFPAAAERLRSSSQHLASRTLEIALARDPSMRARHDDVALQRLLRDTDVLIERVAGSVASGDPYFAREWADWIAPVFRRRRVPMDDLVNLCESLRQAMLSVLTPEERGPADTALDEAIRVFRWYRRIAGDARKRNRLLAAIYKGA